MTISLQDLLVLGQGRDLASERGVSCTGELPAASDPDLVARAVAARSGLGSRALILGHHYQRDEVIQFADITGDSFKLAQAASEQKSAEFIFFCGVHFMAESADILTSPQQKVILPDLAAGCSMADMATASQVQECWKELEKIGVAKTTIPVTYMNSSAAIKSFTGEHGGTICTSSNAQKTMEWALSKGDKTLDDCVLWNPWKPMGGLTEDEIKNATVILWRGHCSVHGRFTRDSVNEVRTRVPGVNVIVHPECTHDVVTAADVVGSTEKIIQTVSQSAPGSKWAVGTELNLVSRLAANNPDKEVVFLDKTVCYCSTMNRIDLPHLVWAMESVLAGHIVNHIKVDERVARFSKLALDQMLAL